MSELSSFLFDPFQLEFMQKGLLAALFLSLSGGLLGSLLILRRLALMGNALAHSLLPGVALAYLFFPDNPISLFFGALLAALLTSLSSALVTRLTRIKEDSAFAALFIVFFGTGVVLSSKVGTLVDLFHFLFGNILSVNSSDLWLTAGTSTVTLSIILLFYRNILLETFDPIFYRATGGKGSIIHFSILGLTALNLVAALQTMGIVLSLGLFILPAVTALLWTNRLSILLIIAVFTAMISSISGIIFSYHASLPSGASIVIALGFCFLLSALISPQHGMITRFLRTIREGKNIFHTPN